jgi:hypothetical protein
MCCQKFEEYRWGAEEDGFRILFWRSFTPHETRKTLLCYQVAGESVGSIIIKFCPWCGCDLKTTLPD